MLFSCFSLLRSILDISPIEQFLGDHLEKDVTPGRKKARSDSCDKLFLSEHLN